MIITTYTAAEQARRIETNRDWLSTSIQQLIRANFDNALTSAEAESWLTIARERGYKELAKDMHNDLQVELLTA